ncbi:MAG: phosphoadenosine phosphosulfate reductase family protein [bacterium]
MIDNYFKNNLPIFENFHFIVVNSSAGKDSQTALRQTVLLSSEHSFDRRNICVSHQDLGRMEWPGTKELAYKQAGFYGIEFIVSKYRTKHGKHLELLDYVKKRCKWPSAKNRYCTSDFKRTPGGRILTMKGREAKQDGIKCPVILNVYGFRAEESPARARKPKFTQNKRFSNKSRLVFDWLPIHHWTENEVWTDIHESGVPYHPAYDLGMPRLSCSFCIFAPRAALICAGHARQEMLTEYVKVEDQIGHSFRQELSLSDILKAVQNGEKPKNMNGNWNM